MKQILLIFAAAAVNGIITYALLTNLKLKISLEEPIMPSGSAEPEEEEPKE